MRLSVQRINCRCILLWIAFVCILIQSGCASVEHVRLYRDARTDFSNAAKSDNLQVLNNMFPDPATVLMLVKNSSPFNFNGIQQSYDNWNMVHSEFVALNSRASKELLQDQLLGSSRTLEIISKSRADLCAQILSAGGRSITPPQTANSPNQPSLDPLTVSVAQAEGILSNKDIRLFPRDEYLLRSLRPTVRYEIAYVNALRARPAVDKKIETYVPIIGQMVQAEKELAEMSGSCADNVKLHATMSRFIMLVSARFLLTDKDKAGVFNLLHPDDSVYVTNAGLQSLSERIHYFRKQTVTSNTPEKNLLENLGVLESDRVEILKSLTNWGLGEIQDPAPQP